MRKIGITFILSFIFVYVTQFLVPWKNFDGLTGSKPSILAAIIMVSIIYLYNYNFYDIIKLLLAIIILASPIAIYRLTNNNFNSRMVQGTLVYAIVIAEICFFIKYLTTRIKIKMLKKFCIIIIGMAFFLSLFTSFSYLCYFILNGELLTPDIILTFFQTNISEAKAYCVQFLGIKGVIELFLIIGMLGILSVWFSYITSDCKTHSLNLTSGIAILLAVIASYMIIPYLRRSIVIKNGQDVFESLSSYKQYTKLSKQKRNVQLSPLDGKNDANGLYVLVIGESETRDHMSAYGYLRNTTPWLKSMMPNPNLILFNNAYSNHTHTIPVLTYALTEKNTYNNLKLEEAASLLEIANTANFETVWISNQVKYSAWDTPVSAIASSADKEHWYNKNVGKTTASNVFDGNLLEAFNQDEIGRNTLVIFHLMGSHGSYEERYPTEYSKFSGSKNKIIDTYDNSILYTDSVLEKIYEKVSTHPNFKAMIYFADHGEDVEENNGHESTKFTFTMSRIPFFIIFSDTFIKERSNTVMELENHRNSVFTNDLICNLMCDLIGIGTKQMTPDLDLASDKYDQDREFKTLHGQKNISDDKQN